LFDRSRLGLEVMNLAATDAYSAGAVQLLLVDGPDLRYSDLAGIDRAGHERGLAVGRVGAVSARRPVPNSA
jgi:hypothetical protein